MSNLGKLPTTEAEFLFHGEWAKQLVLDFGGQPETAYAVAAEWIRGLRALAATPTPPE